MDDNLYQQAADLLGQNAKPGQIHLAATLLRRTQEADRCFLEDHKGRLEHAEGQVKDLRAALERIREVHRCVTHRKPRGEEVSTCAHCSEDSYPYYEVLWPCPTIAALNGPQEET
ncbi:hypothetical protein [Nonomuraea typhae]|uniref:hypothetical protein n=1 Tax=Nonomuraea typhae TaxID=2603600 RepID=UPI0012FAFE4E|nr:hypothetical protein [Nonomuraea typhae]